MASLFDTITKTLTDQAIGQLTKEVGLPQDKGGDIANGVVGLLFDKLAKNAKADPAEAQAIAKAAEKHDPSILDDVLGAFQGGQASVEDGSNILDHIFKGGSKEQVAETVAKNTGGNIDQILSIMKYLAPVVLASLNKQKQTTSGGFGIEDMIGLLGQSGAQANKKSSLSSKIATMLLDQDGDGQLGIGDVISVATGQKKKKSGGLLGSLLGGLLGGKKA